MKRKFLAAVTMLGCVFAVGLAMARDPVQQVDTSVLPPEYQQVANTQMSDDDTWACEVALCMANPDGPTAVAECVKPIEKLYKHLAKGHSFPKCPFVSGGNDGGGSPGGPGGGDGREREAQQIQ